MSVDKVIEDGELYWTALHRAARLNDVDKARQLLQAGANPNLRVRVAEEPVGDHHGHYDSWLQSQCYADKTCLQLAVDMWSRGECYREMRELLKSYGGH